MNLLIDVGNTLTKIFDESLNKVAFILSKQISKNDLSSSLDNYLKENKISDVLVSSVVPSVSQIFKDYFNEKSIKVCFVDHSSQDLVNIKIESPEELGSDLVCDLVASASLENKDTLIIDLGTASKVLYLNKNNQFSYCAIIPGLESSLSVLSNSTALLDRYSLTKPKKLTECKHTNDVVIASVIYSHGDAINGLVRRFENELGIKCKKILTGGYANFIKQYLDFEYEEIEYLTLNGLSVISKRRK